MYQNVTRCVKTRCVLALAVYSLVSKVNARSIIQQLRAHARRHEKSRWKIFNDEFFSATNVARKIDASCNNLNEFLTKSSCGKMLRQKSGGTSLLMKYYNRLEITLQPCIILNLHIYIYIYIFEKIVGAAG